MKVLILLLASVAVLALAILSLRSKQRIRPSDGVATLKSSFSVFRGEIDGRPLAAMIDVGLRDFRHRQTLPFFLSLSTPLIHPTDEGLPTTLDSANLNAWEDAVEERLRTASEYAYLGRVTWKGNREVLFYVANQQSVEDAMQALSRESTSRAFAFLCERDENWQHAEFWLNHR